MAVLLGLMADLERVKYAVLAACLLAWPAAGAAPVEESKGVEVRQLPVVVPETASARTPGAAEAAEEDGDAGSNLGTIYYDFQLMQDEVRRLHGVVEELNHRIARLEREQRERYIELDQRLVEVRSGEGVAPGTGETDPGTVVDPGVVAVPATERDAYNVAIAIVNAARSSPESEREAEYQRALGLFREIIKNYPNGEFTPNAFYWIGELHLAMDDHEDARQAFAQVVLLYEDHPKVPDALYKLGEVYHRLGDDERARFYLERVIGDYPSSTSAGLARSYLSEIP